LEPGAWLLLPRLCLSLSLPLSFSVNLALASPRLVSSVLLSGCPHSCLWVNTPYYSLDRFPIPIYLPTDIHGYHNVTLPKTRFTSPSSIGPPSPISLHFQFQFYSTFSPEPNILIVSHYPHTTIVDAIVSSFDFSNKFCHRA
jgi:hypothetical protein